MAPRLSFVLVVHREQAFLEPCLASILGQDVPDIEVVAVDDASPDHGPSLLDAAAERDARVRVRHLPGRVGLGAARNLALDMAQGDHVWFVRTTDLLAPGAVAAVMAQLRAEASDVLLLQHLRESPVGRRRPAPRQTGIEDASPHVFDKVLRRGLLADLGVRFGSAGHSGLGVTWPALLAASSVAVSDDAGYVRRDPPNAVRDGLTTGVPADALAQYESVLAFAEEHGVPDDRLRALGDAILRHGLALLGGVRDGERRAFFQRLSALVRRAGVSAISGRPARLRERLIVRGDFRAFELLRRSAAARRRARTTPQRLRRQAARVVRRDPLQRHYRARLEEPIDPRLAVFAAYWYRGYACNPRAIYERARELVPDIRGVWVVTAADEGSMPAGVEHVVAGTEAYYDLIARARYFVNNVNFPDHVVKREGQIHVMTHHGTPLKRMGMDLSDAPGKRNLAGVLRRCKRWDFSVSANVFSTLVWERAYPTRYESLETGYPRNDVLAAATAEDVRRVRAGLGIEEGKKVVLYAPTHREYREDPSPPLDLAELATGLGDDHVVMARLHYFHDEHPALRELHDAGRIRDVASHPSVEELCLAADVLVTDYSSIMFDYAVLDRPIVIHAPDWLEYREMRGTYFDLLAEPPGLVATTGAQVLDALRAGDEAHSARAAFRARFCALEDGGAAERVVRRVWSVR
ncbi:MAG: CDP-glycerol glycerophosphotransferase [Solirubrobacteraceae bacterium]|nr:CDP-glycerol glycerophosphotransferase [Solirubrobacteraceae bacterium]